MKNYKIVPESKGRKISFAITTGLSEGYGDAALSHKLAEVGASAEEWMKQRAEKAMCFVTGSVVPGTVHYAWRSEDRSVGSGNESNAVFQGELSHLYGKDLVENQDLAEEVVNDLASFLGNKLGQTRVYVSLGDETWVLQAEETATPTGETV